MLENIYYLQKMKYLLVISLTLVFITANHGTAANDESSNIKRRPEYNNLIPKETFTKIAKKYQKQIKNFASYIQSEEFEILLKNVEETPEFINLNKFLQESNFSAYRFFNFFFNYEIGIQIMNPFRQKRNADDENSSGHFIDFLNELKVVSPVDEMKKLFNKKMQEIPHYRQLVIRLHSDEAKLLFAKLLVNPEVIKLIQAANENDAPIVEYIEFSAFHYGLMFSPEEYQKPFKIKSKL